MFNDKNLNMILMKFLYKIILNIHVLYTKCDIFKLLKKGRLLILYTSLKLESKQSVSQLKTIRKVSPE